MGTSPYDENGVKYLNEKVKMHEFLLGLGLGNQNDLLKTYDNMKWQDILYWLYIYIYIQYVWP